MKEFDVKLTVTDDGNIWANKRIDGQCVLRIQGIEKKKVDNLVEDGQFIDIRISSDPKLNLIVKNEEEAQKAHDFLTRHILYMGHNVKIETRVDYKVPEFIRLLICDCNTICEVAMRAV